jgi:hypothetical protein
MDTRLRRLERHAPDPVQAALNALSDEDLSTALAAIRAAIAGVDVDVSTLPEAVERLFQAAAGRVSLRHGHHPQL